MSQTLLLLLGDVADVSLIHQQLGLRSFAQLRIKNRLYLDPVEEALPNACKNAQAMHLCLGTPTPTVGDLTRALDRDHPPWRDADELVLYPTALYFHTSRTLDAVLTKLRSVAFSARLRHEDLSLLKLSAQAMLRHGPSTRLSDIVTDSDQALEASVVNLNGAMGLFEVSTTQTATRNFNTFRSRLPYIVKTTSNLAKGRDEYAYLANLPAALRAYYPQVGADSAVGADGADIATYSYEIEFVPMLDLGRFWVHGSLLRDLPVVLQELSRYMQAAPRKTVGVAAVRQALTDLFVNKLNARFKTLQAAPIFADLDRACGCFDARGLAGLVARLQDRLRVAIAQAQPGDALAFSHGDLCLPNILFDRTSSRIKLIDPKGQSHTYLPPHYDICKLSHSLRGRYDFIINGLAHVDYDNALRLQLVTPTLKPKDHAAVLALFDAWCTTQGFDETLIRLGEASLFLSMMPLHQDFPARMLQQACVANELMGA